MLLFIYPSQFLRLSDTIFIMLMWHHLKNQVCEGEQKDSQ